MRNKKLGLFRSSYSKNPENSKAIKGLMDEMKAALKTGNKDKIAEVTAKLESAYIGDGKIKQGWNWVKSKVTGKEHKVTTVSEALEKNAKVIILSHLGKIKTEEDKYKNSLKSVYEKLKTMLNYPIYFCEETR